MKSATVQLNYHIAIDFQNYSVLMSMCARKWMSGTPRAALRFITKEIGFAATNAFMDAAGSTSTIRSTCCQSSAVQ